MSLLTTNEIGIYRAMIEDMYRAVNSREILEAALKFMQDGWIKGALETSEGVCILGGLNKACSQSLSGNPDLVPGPYREGLEGALKALRAALLETAEQGAWDVQLIATLKSPWQDDWTVINSLIPYFNDSVAESFEDVALFMKRAIESAEETS
jgi:hypothetical protein